LRRLLWTLLDNAVKYTPERGRIDVALERAVSQTTVTVRDSGIGIPNEALPRVFDRFYRADPSRGQADGTGLGLAIAKWIADAHNATLTAESHAGEGTVFRVTFPSEPPLHVH
jgi:signal transduction histidine kinase